MVSAATGKQLIQSDILSAGCYPTVTNSKTILKYNLAKGTEVGVELKSLEGRTVLSYGRKYLSAGNHQQEIDLNNLSSGVYYCSIISGTGCNISKIIKN
jgi:hypothetical protein